MTKRRIQKSRLRCLVYKLELLITMKIEKCFPHNVKRREIAPKVLDSASMKYLGKSKIHEFDTQNPFKREQGH